ncbi:MAG: polyphosphate kinase 1 [Bacteroidetes bacterium 4572_117]|nr:MAG: polyphosphate kinase 1 [Bacteroidetes bacterium 4572_117]
MDYKYEYYNRELSWLSFNNRVLEEAMDKDMPVYDRIKFLAIHYSNLDEFYRVRVASYRSLLTLANNHLEKLDFKPESILENINKEVIKQQDKFERIFYEEILPELSRNNIILIQDEPLDNGQNDFLQNYFLQEILPDVLPVLLTKGDVLSFLQDNVIYLAVKLFKKKKSKKNKKPESKPKINKLPQYAIIKVPTHKLPRFISLPKSSKKNYIIFLEDIIRKKLGILFPGYVVDSSYSIKISRDAELPIEDEFKGNLVEKIRKGLKKRKTGMPARFLYDKTIPNDFLDLLKIAFNLSKRDLVPSFRYQNINDLWDFPNPIGSKLETPGTPKLHHRELDKAPSILKAAKEKEYMLHFPYHSYDYVIRFFNEAAIDPKVEEIKTTQYRLATNSAIVSSLISAALNGKKVTVFVEFKARFDEEANLNFADRMAKAGINVIPSLPGLKVHAKAALILRRSTTKDGKRKGTAFLGTGNFNEKTALIYADHGYFTSNDELIDEVEMLFSYLENPTQKIEFQHFLVPKFNLRQEFKNKFDREINNAKQGKKAYILFKMNSLEDKKMIDKLYEASIAGVKIDLIIRGICCLVPNKLFSKNIKVTRIVDKYLEHARLYVFYNNGQNEMFMSSADLMKRNLNRRVELMVPVYNENIKKEILDILQIQLNDNTKARFLGDNLKDWLVTDQQEKKVRAQAEIYNHLKK